MPGAWIQGMECTDAVGSFVAPFLSQPFLLYDTGNPWEESPDDVTSHNESRRFLKTCNSTGNVSNLTSKGISRGPMSNGSYILSDNATFAAVDINDPCIERQTHVMYVYVLIGLLLSIVGFFHLCVFFTQRCNVYLKMDGDDEEDEEITEIAENRKLMILKRTTYPLLFLICFGYYSIETGYAQFLMTFVVEGLHWPKDRGILLTSAFWGSYTTATVVGILIIKFVKPRALLLFDISLCVSSQVILTFFFAYHDAVVWCCTVAMGIGTSTVFASVFTWTEDKIGINGKINSLIMFGMGMGEMTSPAVTGVLVETMGAVAWVYFMLATTILCFVVLSLMEILTKMIDNEKKRHTPNVELKKFEKLAF